MDRYNDSAAVPGSTPAWQGPSLLGLTIISLGLIGLIGGLLLGLEPVQAVRLGLALVLLPFLLVAFFGLRQLVIAGIRSVEPLVQRDIDGDSYIGTPPQDTIRLLPVRHSPLAASISLEKRPG